MGDGGFVPAMYRRGIPMRDKASAAQMAKDDYQFRVKSARDSLALAQNECALTMKKITEWTLMINSFDETEEEEKQMLKRQRKHAMQRLDELENKKVKLETESDDLRTQSTQQQVLAFYEQVGNFHKGSVVVDRSKSGDDAYAITESQHGIPSQKTNTSNSNNNQSDSEDES